MTSPDQFDGGINEDDRDETEAALAAAIAALLAAKAAGAPWLDLVRGSLSGLIQDYLRRASLDMALAGGMTPTEAAIAADDATAAVMGDVSRHTASWLAISAKDHEDPKAPDSPMSQDDAEQAGALIARSIATYARERAREDIARKLGATRKRWQTRGDSAVRPAHAALQGAWKPLDKPFKTDGFQLMYPGDPEAPPELTINCRCHLIYTVQ